jgi:hypothetical protein
MARPPAAPLAFVAATAALLLVSLRATAQEDGVADAAGVPSAPVDARPYREVTGWSPVYRQPRAVGPHRGILAHGASVSVVERGGTRRDCPREGWGRLEDGGWICLDRTRPTAEAPVALPELVAFDHPEPDEYFAYRETGSYPREPGETVEPIVPFVYGKRWRQWRAPAWSSIAAYTKGRAPDGNLEGVTKYHFVDVHETPRGTLLETADGQVVPADQVYIYPVDRFQGRDLLADPVDAGQLPAWVVAYDGAAVRSDPRDSAPVMLTLPYHHSLEVDATPVQVGRQSWWRLPDALGPDLDGWIVAGGHGLRVWKGLPRPREVVGEELWIDVDRERQLLGVFLGDTPIYMTLVSTGEGARWVTPRGVYRVYDKSIYGDMRSRDDADEPYAVEAVPWVMHFKTRYALHGVFWHWGFGHAASHGCVNLAPRDAKWIFDHITPSLGKGWHTVYETPEDPGPILRVRADSVDVPDKRIVLQ